MTPRPLALLLAGVLLLGACRDDQGGNGPDGTTSSEPTVENVVASLADEVIIPGYQDLDASLDALSLAIGDLCTAPDADRLEAAQAAWRDADVAFRLTRASGVGPATDRRLNSALGFLARAEEIDALLAGTDPVDADSLAAAGGGVKGLSALEHALFAEGSESLTTSAGARRCAYAASVAQIAGEDAQEVLDDWTNGYRDELVETMEPQMALGMIVNELSHRLTELDDQGLRSMTEGDSLEELADNRQDGPAAFRMAELAALLDSVERVVDGPGAVSLLDLVEDRSPETAAQLDTDLQAAVAAMDALPDSVTEAFGTPELATAQEAASALDVLVATQVASQLGVTIGFSDADGDS